MNAAQRRYDAMSPPDAGCDCDDGCDNCEPPTTTCDLCNRLKRVHGHDDGCGGTLSVCDDCHAEPWS
jgi:hypothetical protein